MSADELVEVVDENENILKTVTKSEAHVHGYLHKTVIAQVIHSDNRWLLTKQSKSRQDPGQYVSPVGGHVTAGETNEQALKREGFEELGLKGDLKYEYVDRAIFNRSVLGRKENHFFIVYKIYSDATPILNEESESCRLFTEDEIKKITKEHPEQFGDAFHFVIKTFFPHFLQP